MMHWNHAPPARAALGDAHGLRTRRDNLAGPDAGETRHRSERPPLGSTAVHLCRDAEVGQRRTPHLADPPERTAHVVVPQRVAGGNHHVHPPALAGEQEHRSPAGAAARTLQPGRIHSRPIDVGRRL